MERFNTLCSPAVPWLMPNIDTDTISPMKRLILNTDELDIYSFEPYRFINGDGDSGILNMDFPLNQTQYKNAKILIAGDNFGCGSSRETAPEAIAKCGIRCIISSSFGGIFAKNCYQQGILPIVFPQEVIQLFAKLAACHGKFVICLDECVIKAPNGEVYHFSVENDRREALLSGMDEVKQLLIYPEAYLAFLNKDKKLRPWMYAD